VLVKFAKAKIAKINVCAAALKLDYEGSVIVIDSGPDFRQQMLRTNTQTFRCITLHA